MKFVVEVAALLLVVASTVTSAIAAGPYIGATGGLTLYHDSDLSGQAIDEMAHAGVDASTVSFDPSYALQLGGGYSFDSGVRLEGEFGYKKADAKDPKRFLYTVFSENAVGITQERSLYDLTVMSLMLNAFYDIKTSSPLTPFVGGGIGALWGKLENYSRNSFDTAFGYQLSAGASYSVTKSVDLSLSYRFEGAAQDFSTGDVNFSYHSSNILGGVRYNFR